MKIHKRVRCQVKILIKLYLLYIMGIPCFLLSASSLDLSNPISGNRSKRARVIFPL